MEVEGLQAGKNGSRRLASNTCTVVARHSFETFGIRAESKASVQLPGTYPQGPK